MQLDVHSLPMPDVKLPDVKLIRMSQMNDAETYVRSNFDAHGFDRDFTQDNPSNSDFAGTVRGMHCQQPPLAKLVRMRRGRTADVATKLRHPPPAAPLRLVGDHDTPVTHVDKRTSAARLEQRLDESAITMEQLAC